MCVISWIYINIKQDEKTIVEIINCPNCDGKIIEKKSKKGKVFYGCNNYPKCKTAYWDMPIGEACPECGKMLVKKKDTIKLKKKERKKTKPFFLLLSSG